MWLRALGVKHPTFDALSTHLLSPDLSTFQFILHCWFFFLFSSVLPNVLIFFFFFWTRTNALILRTQGPFLFILHQRLRYSSTWLLLDECPNLFLLSRQRNLSSLLERSHHPLQTPWNAEYKEGSIEWVSVSLTLGWKPVRQKATMSCFWIDNHRGFPKVS